MTAGNLPEQWIKPNQLSEVVSKSLGVESVKLKDWHYEPLLGGLEFANSLYRWKGSAITGDQTIPWSLIEKITTKEDQSKHPQGYRYWKREALAYQSNLITNSLEHLFAPQIYAIDEVSDDTVIIWMEDIIDDHRGHWTHEVYEDAAYQLGLFSGSFLTQQQLPDEKWMTLDWLKKYVEHAAPTIEFIMNHPNHEVIKSLYGKSVPFLITLWEIRKDLFNYLEKMPQVFCHQDTVTRNLFITKGHLAAIDWGYAGLAPLGTDLVPLIVPFGGLNGFSPDEFLAMNQACLNAYLHGVTTHSPHISARSLRRSVLFILLLRYTLGTGGELVPALLDENTREYFAQAFGKTEEELTRTDEFTSHYFQSKVFETLKLMNIKTKIKFFYYLLHFSFWFLQHAKRKT